MEGSRRWFARAAVALAVGASGCLDTDGEGTDMSGEDVEDGGEDHDYDYSDLELLDEDDNVVAFTMGDSDESNMADVPDHWHFEPLRVDEGEAVYVSARIKDRVVEGVVFGDGTHELRAEVESGDGVVRTESHGDHVEIYGETEGDAELVFGVTRDDETVYETPPFDVTVLSRER